MSFAVSYAAPDYLMRLAGVQKVDENKIEFNIFIKSSNENFELTSYQAALIYNNYSGDDLSLSYISGSSELNIPPSTGIGVNHIDGKTKLTFASMPGSETITAAEIKVGSFILESESSFDNSDPDIQWSFNGNVTTILTGKDFTNITDQNNHTFQYKGQLAISKITASSTVAPTSTDYLTDGKLLEDGDFSSIWKTDKMPAYLVFDLGKEQGISKTKFSFNNWDKGRVYQYSIFTGNDTSNWNEVINNASSASEEWTENELENVSARYIKLVILGQNQNEWATLWEAQILGAGETTDIEDQEKENQVPNDFELSQNYPNPFNPSTKIRFNLKENGKVSLDIYNLLGERVAVLIDQEMNQGIHEVNFDGSSLASGVYIYRLNVENKFSAVKKMMLLK